MNGYDYIVTLSPESILDGNGVTVIAENVTEDGRMVFNSNAMPTADIVMHVLRLGVQE